MILMPRDSRPLIAFLLPAGFVLFLMLTIGPLAAGKARPTELLSDDARRVPHAEAIEVHDLATLTPAVAKRLDGTRSLVRVVIDGLPVHLCPGDSWEVLPRGSPQGTLFVRLGPPAVRGEMRVLTVQVTLTVIPHPVHVAGAVVTPAFVEYRLVDADWVGE
jgi:hypothetical protein